MKSKDINYVFEKNPDLKDIGTKTQYYKYLKTIFPESKVKDIFYHGISNIPDKESWIHEGSDNIRTWNFFYNSKERASDVGEEQYPAILDFSADFDSDEIEYKSSPGYLTKNSGIIIAQGGDEYLVKSKKQIHILGSKKDIQGFKEFVSKKDSLEKRIISGFFIFSIISGLFFSSFNITGNVISTTSNSSSFIGIALSIVGVLGFFFNRKYK